MCMCMAREMGVNLANLLLLHCQHAQDILEHMTSAMPHTDILQQLGCVTSAAQHAAHILVYQTPPACQHDMAVAHGAYTSVSIGRKQSTVCLLHVWHHASGHHSSSASPAVADGLCGPPSVLNDPSRAGCVLYAAAAVSDGPADGSCPSAAPAAAPPGPSRDGPCACGA